MDWLCRHLGHTKPVHKEAYRQMSGLIERVYVTKLMMVQDLNLTGKYKGQSMEEIDLTGTDIHIHVLTFFIIGDMVTCPLCSKYH